MSMAQAAQLRAWPRRWRCTRATSWPA
jgi:hypothetical protein